MPINHLWILLNKWEVGNSMKMKVVLIVMSILVLAMMMVTAGCIEDEPLPPGYGKVSICSSSSSIYGRVYIDGNLISQLDETLSSSYFNKLRIGASEEITPTLFLQASIDDFRVYTRNLSGCKM